MLVKIINPKNKSLVNRAVSNLIKYNEANRLRDIADGDGDEKAFRKLDRRCETLFDKYLSIVDELPKNQVKLIEKALW